MQSLINGANAAIAAIQSGGARLVVDGSGNSETGDTVPVSQEGDLVTGTVLGVYLVNADGTAVPADEQARFDDAINALDSTFGPYGVNVVDVGAGDAADAIVQVQIAATSAAGVPPTACSAVPIAGQVTLVTGWNWYTGADPTAIGADQYDFEAIVMHELGHSIGLGHSGDTNSVMYPYLGTDQVRRVVTTQDMSVLEANSGTPEPLLAAPGFAHSTAPSASAPTATSSGLGAAQSLAASLAMSTAASPMQAPSPVSLTPTVTASATFGPAAATGSSFAVSIGSFSLPATAQSLGSISNSTSAGMTSAPLSSSSSSSWSSPAPASTCPSGPRRAVGELGERRGAPGCLVGDGLAAATTRTPTSSSRRGREGAGDRIRPGRPGRRPAPVTSGQDRDGAAPADVPALPPTGVAVAPGAAMCSMPLDQDGPSAKSAVGLVAIGLAAGLWAARDRDITAARRRRPWSRSARGKSLDLGSGIKA